MNKIEQNINLIDRYLQNKLTKDELAMFNQMLQEDTEFEKLFFEMDQLVAGIRFSSRTSTVEEKLARLELSLPLIQPRFEGKKKFNRYFGLITENINSFLKGLNLKSTLTITQVKLAFSGVAAIILITFGILINNQRTLSPVVLFNSNFNPPMYENFGATREAGDQITDPVKLQFNEAMRQYNRKNYEASLGIINSIPETKQDPEMKLYDAIVNIELENYGIAKQILTGLTGTHDESWANQARWYLALCLVRNNEFTRARPLLTQVKDFGSVYSREAGKLLDKIK